MTENAKGHITLLGGGRMGSALYLGWLARGLPARLITVVDPYLNEEDRAVCRAKGMNWEPALTSDILTRTDCLLLAVKPQGLEEALAPVSGQIRSPLLVLSIIAGKSRRTIGNLLGSKALVVRAMPNTPSSIGLGMTGVHEPGELKTEQKALITDLLSAVGDLVWVDDESQIDAITAISGSGPAYFFYLTECLADAGVTLGLNPDIAQKLASATLRGAGALPQATGLDVAELRKNVSSPGGTTLAALDVLREESAFADLILAAAKKAAERARALSG